MELKLLPSAEIDLDNLKTHRSKARILKDVVKTLNLMEANLRHPSLNTHEFQNFAGPNDEKVFGAYAQQNTPRAYRILLVLWAGEKYDYYFFNYTAFRLTLILPINHLQLLPALRVNV